jgi:ATP-dependent RNA helicase DDX41
LRFLTWRNSCRRYLLIKGIDAVSTHGGKDQEERDEAVMRFKKSERADVLVATDVAAKGLDFPDVQQVRAEYLIRP